MISDQYMTGGTQGYGLDMADPEATSQSAIVFYSPDYCLYFGEFGEWNIGCKEAEELEEVRAERAYNRPQRRGWFGHRKFAVITRAQRRPEHPHRLRMANCNRWD